MRLSGTKTGAVNQYRGLGNQLWDLAGNRPSLDLPFSDTKSLVDTTTGKTLVDHTRASSGTYVGSDGLIKTATTNLLLRSEEFGATWTTFQASVSPDLIAAPNGTTTADKLKDTAVSSTHAISQAFSTLGATVHTFSVYAKAGERNFIQLVLGPAQFSTTIAAIFDLTTGVVGSTSGSPVTASVPVGNGWWRVSISSTATAAGSTAAAIRVANASNTGTYTGDGTSGIYIWGAQLEQSSTVGEYVKTTSTINSAPRFDHDPTTGESLGLLVEESRTNLALQSQALTTPPWSDTAATTSLASTITDVFGGTSASFKLTEDNTNTSHFVNQAFTLAASTYYSVTAWFKQGSANRDGRILLTNASAWDGSSAPRARIEFSTGTVQNVLGFTSTSLASYSNGWYRFTGTALTSASGGTSAFRLLVSDGSEVYQGDGTSYVYVGPCQLEAGSFPTSYIPTEGTTVTRAADVASISGSNFSSWYRQDEQSIFAMYSQYAAGGNIYTISDGTAANFITLQTNSIVNKIASANVFVASTNIGRIDSVAAFTAGSPIKAAYGLSNGSRSLVAQGETAVTAANPATLPVVDRMFLGSNNSGVATFANGQIRRLTFWPTLLSNETLQGITQ